MELVKYKQNLRVIGDKVFSYNTRVATIKNGLLLVHGYWSMTTSKHVNYVADMLGLEKVMNTDATKRAKIESEREEVEESNSSLKTIALVASLGDIFGKNQKESNDWKARMLKAGLEGRGLIMPDDWDSLSEETKQARLDDALAQLQ